MSASLRAPFARPRRGSAYRSLALKHRSEREVLEDFADDDASRNRFCDLGRVRRDVSIGTAREAVTVTVLVRLLGVVRIAGVRVLWGTFHLFTIARLQHGTKSFYPYIRPAQSGVKGGEWPHKRQTLPDRCGPRASDGVWSPASRPAICVVPSDHQERSNGADRSRLKRPVTRRF